MASGLHTIALLKGAVEGDPYRHLASLTAVRDVHLPAGIQAGLLAVDGGGGIVSTDEGLAFYRRHGLAGLPEGRANMWPVSVPGLVGPVLEAFGRLV